MPSGPRSSFSRCVGQCQIALGLVACCIEPYVSCCACTKSDASFCSLSASEVILPLCDPCLVAVSLLSFAKLSYKKQQHYTHTHKKKNQVIVESKGKWCTASETPLSSTLSLQYTQECKCKSCAQGTDGACLWMLH